MNMYIPTGHLYEDVTTHYIKIIPGFLVLSKSHSLEFENDPNDHKSHRRVANHWAIHLWFLTLSITTKISDKTNEQG